jgi:uncharacterized membrane protein
MGGILYTHVPVLTMDDVARVVVTAAFAFVLDQLWFSFSLVSLYTPAITSVTGAPARFHTQAAALSWLTLATLVTYTRRMCPEISPAILGFLVYSLCNFTIKAMFPAYHWGAILGDIVWGTLMVAVVFSTYPKRDRTLTTSIMSER